MNGNINGNGRKKRRKRIIYVSVGVALVLVIGALVLIVYGGEQTAAPLSALNVMPVSLDPANLPVYALRTTMRMLLAIVCSIIFTFIYAALAAKSRRAETVLIPLLDILQSSTDSALLKQELV